MSLIIISCKDKKSLSIPIMVKSTVIPRAVYNKCTNVWAVATHEWADEDNKIIMSLFGKDNMPISWSGQSTPRGDSSDYSTIELEYKYEDSLTAINNYLDFKKREKHITDSTAAAYQEWKRKSDSLYKCQHTYQ